jgi:hypothetical protein
VVAALSQQRKRRGESARRKRCSAGEGGDADVANEPVDGSNCAIPIKIRKDSSTYGFTSGASVLIRCSPVRTNQHL